MLIITILIVVLTIVILLALHEFGHFIAAKKFGMKVEEFGVGYPPRIWGKKVGETLYSINLLPFGAFVKIPGEDREVKGPGTFNSKPIWQRAIVLLGGIISFWIIAFIIFSLIAGVWGLPTAVSDNFEGKANVQVALVSKDSPADEAGLRIGDEILRMESGAETEEIEKVAQVQEFTDSHRGEETTIYVKRGEEELSFSLVPRVDPPKGEGEIGIGLVRAARFKYPWYGAIYQGAKVTVQKTIQLPVVMGSLLGRAIQGEKVEGVELVGPVGLGEIMGQSLMVGVDRYLMFVAMIAVWLALFNALPIPALDGGRLLFLIIEGIRRKPVSQKIEQGVTAFFFVTLVLIMIFVTIKDIIRLI